MFVIKVFNLFLKSCSNAMRSSKDRIMNGKELRSRSGHSSHKSAPTPGSLPVIFESNTQAGCKKQRENLHPRGKSMRSDHFAKASFGGIAKEEAVFVLDHLTNYSNSDLN